MQNSRVIRRVNASLARCLSHHRRLCRDIDELDRLLFNDEFLRDPRTQWLLLNRNHKEAATVGVDLTLSEEGKALSGSSSDSVASYQRRCRSFTCLVPCTPTRQGYRRADY